MIAIQGRIRTGSYEKKDGTKVYTTDVVAEDVQIFGMGREEGFRVRGYDTNR